MPPPKVGTNAVESSAAVEVADGGNDAVPALIPPARGTRNGFGLPSGSVASRNAGGIVALPGVL
jgi:hypothetical protein